jgi:2-polyprenyl-6-methoxyphenol hydroxylase-like FAD-dependent oxidoreductase
VSRSVLVLGAAPAGAAATLCLARRGFDVTVIEVGRVQDASEPTRRGGAPHRRQGHSLLAMATRILQEEAPDRFTDATASLQDEELIGAAAERVFNMLMTPDALLSERGIVRRVLRESRTGTAARPSGGPT